MMNEQQEAQLKQLYFTRKKDLSYYENDEGCIVLQYVQTHWIQRLFRKFGCSIPKVIDKTLDDYGSFVFKLLDGTHSVYTIGELLSQTFPEAKEQLYQRLMQYLHLLENDEQVIQRV